MARRRFLFQDSSSSTSVTTFLVCGFIIAVIMGSSTCDSSSVTQKKSNDDDLNSRMARHKRFILQFQVPQSQNVGHFRIAMMPPFISNMMANLPSMIRRSFIFGGNKQTEEGSGIVENN